MALKPFEFQEQFMIDNFLLKVTQFEEENRIDKYSFLFRNRVYLSFNKKMN